MIRFLLAFYPRAWRRTYGEELAALLEQTRLTPAAILDVLAQAAKVRVNLHRSGLLVGAAALVSVAVEVVVQSARLAPNLLWLPTGPAQTVALVALVALVAPWAGLAVRAGHHRSHRRPAQS